MRPPEPSREIGREESGVDFVAAALDFLAAGLLTGDDGSDAMEGEGASETIEASYASAAATARSARHTIYNTHGKPRHRHQP